MDLSTLISPLLNFVARAHSFSKNEMKNNPGTAAAIDRSLGTAAALGLTIALYKHMHTLSRREEREEVKHYSQNNNPDINRYKYLYSIQTVFKFLVRVILMGAGMKRLEAPPVPSETNEQKLKHGESEGNEFKILSGSCHCKSISFNVRASSKIQAKDCHGKIRYPHYLTNSESFQLIKGSAYLSVYYVNLDKDMNAKSVNHILPNSRTSTNTNKKLMAAHTFCKRCGVHILRVPDSKSNLIEINTNCFDIQEGSLSISVSFDENKDNVGLGSGHAFLSSSNETKNPFSVVEEEEEDENEKFFSHQNTFTSSKDSDKDWNDELFSHNILFPSEGAKPWSNNLREKKATIYRSAPDTPTTFATSASTTGDDSVASSSPSYDDTLSTFVPIPYEDELSTDDQNVSRIFDTNALGLSSIDTGVSRWPTTSSVHSHTPRGGLSSPHSFGNRTKTTTPSPIVRDQLKYYMEKYLANSTKPLQK